MAGGWRSPPGSAVVLGGATWFLGLILPFTSAVSAGIGGATAAFVTAIGGRAAAVVPLLTDRCRSASTMAPQSSPRKHR